MTHPHRSAVSLDRLRKELLRPSLALVLLLGAAGLNGCADRASPSAEAAAAPPAAVAPAQAGAAIPASSRAMRINVEMRISVEDVEGSVSALRNAVSDAGGYVSDAKISGADNFKRAALELKVPVAKLGSFRDTVAATGKIESESEKAEDVTEQRADLKARVKNARTQEKRLLELLSDRTGSLADVIAAEKSLGEVRELVERLEAQDATLDGQIAFATVKLQVDLRRNEEVVSVSGQVGDAFSRGITLAGRALVGTVVVVGTAGPTLLMFALFGYLMFRLVKALRLRFKPKSAHMMPPYAPPR